VVITLLLAEELLFTTGEKLLEVPLHMVLDGGPNDFDGLRSEKGRDSCRDRFEHRQILTYDMYGETRLRPDRRSSLVGISSTHQWIESTTWEAQLQEFEAFSETPRSSRQVQRGMHGHLWPFPPKAMLGPSFTAGRLRHPTVPHHPSRRLRRREGW